MVDKPKVLRHVEPDRRAAEHQLQCLPDTHDARQPHSATGAWEETESDLRQTERQVTGRAAIMARER